MYIAQGEINIGKEIATSATISKKKHPPNKSYLPRWDIASFPKNEKNIEYDVGFKTVNFVAGDFIQHCPQTLLKLCTYNMGLSEKVLQTLKLKQWK